MATKQSEALAASEISIRVKRNSIFQVLPFRILRRKTATGDVPYLVLDRFLDVSELSRIAEEYCLPVESPAGRVFPRGKKEQDFVGL